MSRWKIGDRVRVVLDTGRQWYPEQVSTLEGAVGTVAEIGVTMFRVAFDAPVQPWWREHGRPVASLWFDGDELAAHTPRAGIVVHLRAPKKGERGWWVENVSSASAALREVIRECCSLMVPGDAGWLAEEDYAWAPDEHNMYPVTLEVIS